MRRISTASLALLFSIAACAFSLWRAAAQAPLTQPVPLSGTCDAMGQPCHMPVGCSILRASVEPYCATSQNTCCQYRHNHYWYVLTGTETACNPAECEDYVLDGQTDDVPCVAHYCQLAP